MGNKKNIDSNSDVICKVCNKKSRIITAIMFWFDLDNDLCSVTCAKKERILVIDLKFNKNINNRIWDKKYFYNKLEAEEYFESHPRPNDLVCYTGDSIENYLGDENK